MAEDLLYDLIIVGGGASGLFAAANAGPLRTLLIDSKKRVGSKLLISGQGMCNFTNTDSPKEFLTHFGSVSQSRFLQPSVYGFSCQDTLSWFTSRGMECMTREDGKIFPASLKAQTVIDTLLTQIQENQRCTIHTGTPVTDIRLDKGVFTVKTSTGGFSGRSCLLCTGGKSYPATGSDGSGYELARALGLPVTRVTEALVGIRVKDHFLASCSGISFPETSVRLSSGTGKRTVGEITGDLLITHKGFSGPVILNGSRCIEPEDELTICFLSQKQGSIPEQRRLLEAALTSGGRRRPVSVIRNLGVPAKVAELFARRAAIGPEVTCAELSRTCRQALVQLLTEYRCTVDSKGPFTTAMATSGGVDLGTIDRKSMASKQVPGLYVAGELLDIDGDTGGYNIQAAFSTAYCAISSIRANIL